MYDRGENADTDSHTMNMITKFCICFFDAEVSLMRMSFRIFIENKNRFGNENFVKRWNFVIFRVMI